MRLANRTAIVTGAGSGIGRATATLFGHEGAKVYVADVDEAASYEVAKSIAHAESLVFDVADEAAWRRAIERVVLQDAKLDILVNNAGISLGKPIVETSFDEWRSVLSVNLDGIFLGTKHAIETMSRSGGGSIVNVASVSGIKPSPGATSYCTSKAAIRMFSKSAALECVNAQNGIRINVVSPGGVKTPMWEKQEFFQAMIDEHGGVEQAFEAMTGGVPMNAFFSSEEVAATILYLASDESAHLTGTETVLDRGQTG